MSDKQRTSMIVASLFGVMFLLTVDYQFLIPLLPTLSREFGVSIENSGWLFSGYALAAATFNLFVGPLTDRFGRVVFLRWGLLSFALIALLTQMAATFTQLFWLRIFAGVSGGLLSACTSSFIGDFFPYQRRGRAMGMVLSSYFVALILGVPVAAWVAEAWDWRKVFLLSVLLALVLLACCFLVFPRDRSSSQQLSISTYLTVYPRLLVTRLTAAGLAVSFAVSGGTLAFLTFVSGYLDQAFGLGPLEISGVLATVGVAAAVATPFAGWLADRVGKRKIFLWANTLLVVPILALTGLEWGLPLIMVFFLISLCVGFRQTALQTLQTELVDSATRGSFLALRNSFSQVGISVSVFVAGNLYSISGYQAVTGWAALLTLTGSAILYWAVVEPEANK